MDWRSDSELDGHVLEYLAHVEWSARTPVLTLLTRDQRRMEYRELDPVDWSHVAAACCHG